MITVDNTITITQVISKSRFICEMHPVSSKEDASQVLKKVRANHPKANHHCYAYIIYQEYQNIENQSDDGEPNKSAGMPMLEVLRHKKMVNVLVVVIRYFGGTLLGVGGLVKAYTSSVQKAIDQANLRELKYMYCYAIVVSYHNLALIKYEIEKNQGVILNIDYQEKVRIYFLISTKSFVKYLMEKSKVELDIKQLTGQYY